jgi:hypothetical protein
VAAGPHPLAANREGNILNYGYKALTFDEDICQCCVIFDCDNIATRGTAQEIFRVSLLLVFDRWSVGPREMYSLYRAWLSLGPCPIPALPPAPLNLTAPAHAAGAPDVTLQVGPGMTQFSAHRAVLSAHSGFFKAALINHAGN